VLRPWRQGGSAVGAGADFARLALTREDFKRDERDIAARYEEHGAVHRGRM
jgi:hypothetical protein